MRNKLPRSWILIIPLSTLGLDDYDYRGLLFYTSYTDAKVVGFQICQKIETIIILTYYDVIIRYKIERIITAEGRKGVF